MSLSPLPSYETHKCYYDKDPKINGGTTDLNGTYFFSAAFTIGGNAIVKGTATLVLFPTARLKITGGPTIQLTAPKDHPELPPPLSSVSGLMKDLLIYDPEPEDQNNGVNVTGGSDSYFNGTVYVPNCPVTYGGNSAVGTPDAGCFQVIAYAVTFSGNPKLTIRNVSPMGPLCLKPVCAVGAMMRKLDQRGVAALEFCLVAVPLFTLMFAIFDLGRYAITMQSLRMLANAGARAIMISCYTDAAIKKELPTGCTDGPLPSVAARKTVAPFLYAADLTPRLNTAAGASALTVTASHQDSRC